MASSRYTFTLDLHSTYSQITLPVTAGDTDRELAISFADGDRPYTFEANDIVTVALKYPETGATAMYATEISDDFTYCVFELSQKYINENGEEAYGSLCPVAGVYDAEVHIFRGGKKIASPYFSLEAAGGLVAGGEIPPADRNELAAIYAAEADRRTAETNRENAEKARDNAETARNTAEETRNELYNEVKNAYESGKLKGEKGDKGDRGGQGDKGDPGEGFKISKTYPSIKAMEDGASSDGVPVHGFVIIETGNVEEEDNAKLFIKGEDGKYTYLTDLSGSQGFKGDDGDSIYVTDTIYTEEDDAYNIIKLSDGTELRIKNGRTGAPVAIIGVDESDASGGTNTVTFSNGVTLSIKNGKDGAGIADIQKAASSGLVDTYRITLDDGATKYYTVTNGKDGIDGTSVYVASVNSTDAGTTVVFSDGTTIYIANGTNGKTAYQYAKEQGFSGTEEAFAIKLAQPIPSKTSDLSNDSGYVTGSAITTHNVSDASHSDIRLLIQGLADRINAIANSTDVDLDDFKEVVAYIKANRGLIDAITTNKINYTDIINDLVTNVTNKPLSAAQGVVLKALIDNLTNNKLDASALTSAINTALAQAKESGEFKGEDGKTPYIENGYWYINGTSTGVKAQGNDGKGISSVAKTSTNGLVDTYTITFTDGTKTTYTVTNGAAGTSVTVSSVSESTASGGSNVVTFSDGKTVTIKNGKDGASGTDGEDIPQYVIDEAEATIAKVFTHGNLGRTIRFIAISDSHEDSTLTYTDYNYGEKIVASNKHAGQAIKYIADRIGLDFIAHLGDATSAGSFVSSYRFNTLCNDIKQISKQTFSGTRAIKSVFLVGNHDEYYSQTDGRRLWNSGAYNLFGSLCAGNKDRVGGYGYFDIDDAKVRVIYLNTSDDTSSTSTGTLLAMTQGQKNWLCETLIDTNTKDDADKWKILLLSHAPLDWGNTTNIATDLLLAYVDGGSYNGYAFSGKNAVKIISNVHGHVHCYSWGYLANKIRRFTIPNACFVGHNHYKSRSEYAQWADEVSYPKTANSGKDTAFSLVTIDLDSGECYVDNYGAGIDRAFGTAYKTTLTSISNISYSGDTTVESAIDVSKFSFVVSYSDGTSRTVNGATSVSPTTIGSVGNNTVSITYTEEGITVGGTTTIVGTEKPVVNLLNLLDRTYEQGDPDTLIKYVVDNTKAYINVTYSNGAFKTTTCTVSDISENGITIKESGHSSHCVVYPIKMSDFNGQTHRLKLDYSGTGKSRVYWRYLSSTTAYDDPDKFLGPINAVVNASSNAGGSLDTEIPVVSYAWVLIMLSANTGGTVTYSNVSLTPA